MNVHSVRPALPDGLEACVSTINTATLDGDFDEARLCLAQLREKLAFPGLLAVRQAADRLMDVLGPAGTQPSAGLGAALVGLSDALARLQAC